jgi:hypothetical protein
MRFAIIAIGAVATLAALPATARDHQKNYPNLGKAIAAGCKVQHVHTPAGKLAMVDPIVRCDESAPKLAVATDAAAPVLPSAPAR